MLLLTDVRMPEKLLNMPNKDFSFSQNESKRFKEV